MSPFFLYTDARTRAALIDDEAARVLLIGWYGGFNNFGDILQLKGAIRFHRVHTGLRPVVVCFVGAHAEAGFIDRVRGWFDVEDVVFLSDAPLDLGALGLAAVSETRPIDHLHLYGGGILNPYWGALYIGATEFLLTAFQVRHYVVSGQQLDPALAPALQAHFQRHRPGLAGGRDAASAEMIRAWDLEGGYSFDDAADTMLGWLDRRPPATEATPRLFLHLNTSPYTGRHDPAAFLRRVAALRDRLGAGRSPLLLQAYDDVRLSIKDTLPSVVALDDAFPFTSYHVLDLAKASLALDPGAETPDACLALIAGGVGLSSSYHVTLFLNLAGVPCFLHSGNPFYQQKAVSLGTPASFEAFLAAPTPVSYASELAGRAAWLDRLQAYYAACGRAGRRADRLRLPEPARPQPFRPKHDELAAAQEELARYRALAARLGWLRGPLRVLRRLAGR